MTISNDPPFAGLLETHLTVRAAPSSTAPPSADAPSADAPSADDRLVAWAAEQGWKAIHIVLDRGVTPSQPMLSRRRRGTLAGELAAARAAADALGAEGYTVTRIKIEVDAGHDDAPQSDEFAKSASLPSRYFEHHVKLILKPADDVAALLRSAVAHGAHLSRNAFRRRDDGRSERFVTQRGFAMGRAPSIERLDRLVAALRGGGFEVLEVESEFVVYDSDRSLDAGWLPPEK